MHQIRQFNKRLRGFNLKISTTQLVIAIFTALLINSPTFGGSTPKCSDTAVKEAVISISEETLRDSLMRQVSSEHGFGVSPTLKFTDMKEWSQSGESEDERFIPIVEQVEFLVKESSVSLKAVRTQGTRSSVNKSYCEADMLFAHNGIELPIKYTAQLTDDGELYVEVSGL